MPIFMQAKPQDEWTDDEKKAHAEYEKKCKELNEEREKYKKVSKLYCHILRGVLIQ